LDFLADGKAVLCSGNEAMSDKFSQVHWRLVQISRKLRRRHSVACRIGIAEKHCLSTWMSLIAEACFGKTWTEFTRPAIRNVAMNVNTNVYPIFLI